MVSRARLARNDKIKFSQNKVLPCYYQSRRQNLAHWHDKTLDTRKRKGQ